MKPECETCGETRVEIVGIPWHPVMPVVNVWVGVVPCPMQEVDANNVVRNVDEYGTQTDSERFSP